MASLSNINGLFDVHSTGAILFSTSHGLTGQILRSNGDAAPTWVAASTVIGGPYVPIAGDVTINGYITLAAGKILTVGGNLFVTGTSTLTGALSGSTGAFSSTLTVGGNLTVTGNQYFNGEFIEGDGKEMFRYSNTWLRINEDNDFTEGIYCGTGILRTDGRFEVGSGGTKFLVTAAGAVTALGNITAPTFNGLAINTTGTNNVANQIVRTDVNGYANFGWINTISGASSGTITRIYASQDAYVRYMTPASFRTQITDPYYAPTGTVSGVTSVATGSGLTGGTITATGTLSLDRPNSQLGAVLATYGTTAGSSGRIRCTAPFNTNSGKMFSIEVTLYTSYTQHNYVVSAYMYSTQNQWYEPKAVYTTTGTATPDIYVGRDANGKAYISIANASYTGVLVHNMTRGFYTSVADTYDPWTISVNSGTENSRSVVTSQVWTTANHTPGNYLPLAGGIMSGNIAMGGASVTGAQDFSGTEFYATGWFRNSATNKGLYNSAHGNHFYADSGYWNIGYGGTTGLRLRNGHAGTIMGYLYGETSGEFGLLDKDGHWTLRTDGASVTELRANNIVGLKVNSSGNTHVYGQLTVGNSTSSDIYFTDTDDNTRRMHCNSNRLGFLNLGNSWSAYSDNAGNWIMDYAATVAGTLTANGQITANSTIYLKKEMKFPEGALSSVSGAPPYAMYQTAGAWTYPYPDLNIVMHTGIRMAANSGYGGFRFYSDYNTLGTASAQIMSINNGGDGLAAGNVYVNSSLVAGSSLRAPIFYEWNNTSRYLDLAGTSNISTLIVNGSLTANSNIIGNVDSYFNQSVGIGFTSGNIGGRLNIRLSAANQIGIKTNLGGHSGVTGLLSYTSASMNSSGYHLIFQAAPTSGSDTNMLLCNLNGNLRNRNNSYGQYSDRTIKENITDATPKLEDVKRLRIRNFNFIGDDLKQIGLIAQETEEVFPGLVETDLNPQGDMIKSLKYSVLVPILVKAMQEQQVIIDDLKSRIETLEL